MNPEPLTRCHEKVQGLPGHNGKEVPVGCVRRLAADAAEKLSQEGEDLMGDEGPAPPPSKKDDLREAQKNIYRNVMKKAVSSDGLDFKNIPLIRDHWKHREEHLLCRSCMWFVRKEMRSGKTTSLGRCRKRAPTLQGFPAVFEQDWCGDHKIDEEKA